MNSKIGQISIIIPVYNAEKYLVKCLDSVISQSYKNVQIIVVDDGSKDTSYKICKKYTEIDERIELYHNENSGVSATRNFGIQKATGEYIGFVDSDDWIEPEMFEKLYSSAQKYDADISICGYQKELSNGKVITSSQHVQNTQLTKEEAIEYALDSTYYQGFVWNKIFRRTLFLHELPPRFDENIHIQEDLLFLCEAIKISSKIAYYPENLYHYISFESSATLSGFNVKHLTSLVAHQRISDICLEMNPKLIEKLQTRELLINLNILGKICKSKECYKEWNVLILRNIRNAKLSEAQIKTLEMKYRISLKLISISPFLFHRVYYVFFKLKTFFFSA